MFIKYLWIVVFSISLGFVSKTHAYEFGNDHYPFEIEFKPAFDIGGQPVFSMLQDSDGFVWFGSFFSGAVRFDGNKTKNLITGKNGISSKYVSQLFEDKAGNIWIGTNDGLNLYDKSTNKITIFKHDPNQQNTIVNNSFNNSAQTIAEDTNGNIWLGTQDGVSVYNVKNNNFTNFRHNPKLENSLPGNDIFSLHIDTNENVWVAAKDAGLAKINSKTHHITRIIHNPKDLASLPFNDIYSIAQTQEILWFGTKENGLIKFNTTTGKYETIQYTSKKNSPVPQMWIWKIVPLKSGKLALIDATQNVGLVIFDPNHNTFETFKQSYGLATNTIHGVLEDATGILWVVHSSGKVDKFDPNARKFKLVNIGKNGLSSDSVMPIYEDNRGDVWIGHFGSGLDHIDKETGTFRSFKPDTSQKTSLPHGYPSGMYQDGNNFYVSTAAGITLFDRDKGAVIQRLTENTFLYDFQQDANNPELLWASGWIQGLCSFNKKTYESKCTLHDPDDLNTPANNSALQNIRDTKKPNHIYLATWGGGMDRFDTVTKTFKHYQHKLDDPKSISSNSVYDVFIDRNDTFWVATQSGLNKFNRENGTFDHIKGHSGFNNAIIHNILQDDNGYLWMGTSIGLVKFDPEKENLVDIFTKEDGLHSHNFFATSKLKDSNGKLWFGGFGGLNIVEPKSITKNKVSPRVFLTSLSSGGAPIETKMSLERLNEIQLNWDRNIIEFSYVALNFTNSQQNQYKYKLEGYDKDWFNAGSIRNGRYVALPGGTYVLRIKGSNNDGVWSQKEQEVALKIIVATPPWMRWWAIIIYVALLAVLLIAIYQIKMRATRQYQTRLEKDIQDRTKMLSDAYGTISESIEYASSIQRSLLPKDMYLKQDLDDYFVIWEPRDIVGGDLYWYRRCEGGFLIILADCTGHGVPGAFMTMLTTGGLDRGLRTHPDGDPAKIISSINRSIQHSLSQHQGEGESDDGLELGVCRIHYGSNTLTYAGARFSLLKFNGDDCTEVKGDKTGIGYRHVDIDRNFTLHDVPICEGDTFTMFSDGITDQVGGERRRGFGKKRLKQLLLSVQDQPMQNQRDTILEVFSDFQGDEKRRDDLSVISFKLK
ncbi:exported hypothetical protein [Candidatus Terasakiella magnetica]|uniref:PPM-type phosphatase domain-containing protein n=1 Tax=Candidatus Terasakiella magnetica TaxID=1867952 RepID=A0A1C3RKB1_9PROT|nr:two-component regulator propeller domain-containing protein [Candidatus Terasakiella magnetica]SCA57760.1 exported hypothetical protein [Candidatus Terasakiella magnetica]